MKYFAVQMALEISWTRRAMCLPPEVRDELGARLERLSGFFPEMRRNMKVGITRFYDGLVFQSNQGFVKLMVDVHKSRKKGWIYPGRPMLYAAAVAGQIGVSHAIQLLRDEIDRDMAMLGANTVAEMTRDRLMDARGFDGFGAR